MMNEWIKRFKQEFNTSLTDREQMIFNYAYNCGKQKLVDDNSIETCVCRRVVGCFRDMNFRDSTQALAKDLNLECKITYVATVFGFPGHSTEYSIVLKGRRSNIESFHKMM